MCMQFEGRTHDSGPLRAASQRRLNSWRPNRC
jgi:hypothetical protein